jgi:hypothetical protein
MATRTPATAKALKLASELAPAPREIEIISAKNQVFVLILNDDATLENHDILGKGIVDLGNASIQDLGDEKIQLLVKNNPQRYTWETKDTMLYVYENLSVRARAQPDAQPIDIPFSADVTRIRFVEVYPTTEYQTYTQTFNAPPTRPTYG